MYKRSCGKIITISEDLLKITVRIKLSYKNKNYVGSMFGGSMFSASDPIYMIQYMEILNHEYVVWDKSATIRFLKPAKENVYMDFVVLPGEIEQIKREVAENGKYTFYKTVQLTNKTKNTVFAEVEKELYVASKTYYKQRNSKR